MSQLWSHWFEFRPKIVFGALQGAKIWLSNNASRGLFALATAPSVDKNGPVASADKKVSASASEPICQITPVALAKAIKNEKEIAGFVACHVRDGGALCAFFAWLEKEVSKGTVTEISAAEKLLEYRMMMRRFVGPSFETISAVGSYPVIHFSIFGSLTCSPFLILFFYFFTSGAINDEQKYCKLPINLGLSS